MREVAEFRVDERYANLLFGEHEGTRLGDSVRKVELETSDPRFLAVGRLQNELRQRDGRPFFYGWDLRRTYTTKELDSAALFQLKIRSVFEPAGEECGSQYDESVACAKCGAGARLVGPLFLDLKRIPRKKHISKTIAGEIVVARSVVDVLRRSEIRGFDADLVRASTGSRAASSDWFTWNIRFSDAAVVSPTRAGDGLFDDDSQQHRCPVGDLIGLNLLSEVSVSAASIAENLDMFATAQFVGVRRGLLRPERILLVSPRVRHLATEYKWSGCQFEIAHVV